MNKFILIAILSIIAVFAVSANPHKPADSEMDLESEFANDSETELGLDTGAEPGSEEPTPDTGAEETTPDAGAEPGAEESTPDTGAEPGSEEPTPDAGAEETGATGFEADCLKAHNPFRTMLGIEPLTYSEELAATAKKWANTLAGRNGLGHSKGRNRIGENLAMGTKNAYDTARLISLWTNEKKYFRNKKWPNVSTTGNWKDVAHYSQIVWANTKEVGCAVTENNKNKFIVCHYKPAGNWVGDLAY